MFGESFIDDTHYSKIADYGTALLSHYLDPPVPPEYAQKLSKVIKSLMKKHHIQGKDYYLNYMLKKLTTREKRTKST